MELPHCETPAPLTASMPSDLVTSNTERVHPFHVLLDASATGLEHDSKAQAEQIRSVAGERIGISVGVVPAPLLAALDEALRLHLAL